MTDSRRDKTELPGSAQHDAWTLGRAADAYFERNREHLDADTDLSRSTQFYASHISRGVKVLEIGSSNGWILEQLRRLTNCDGYGIDPSALAIRDGQTRYPTLRLSVGAADEIPYPDAFFDVVLIGFCLYLIDRLRLMRVVAEVDRVLADEGKLMITDFDPIRPHRRPFVHQEQVWSYKMSYPNLWLANPAFSLVEKIAFNHRGDHFHVDENERLASWILWKDIHNAYPDSV
jgi:ubiquinone/menaquinone biosynthesis C-methylase UbiE